MDSLTRLRVARLEPGAPGLVDILSDHAAHSAAHYPAESNHHLDAAGLTASAARLYGGWLGGRLVAVGGYVPLGPEEAEVKSMHVHASARGRGAGRAILRALVDGARAEGLRRLRLETGSREASAAARRLYLSEGFVETGPFGAYRPDDESVFMCRDL